MDKQHIIDEIKRTAEENGGKPLGIDRFKKETGIRRSDWKAKHWLTWGDALKEAGYKPNKLKVKYEDEIIIEKMICLIRDLGKYPVHDEIRMRANQDSTFPCHSVFSKMPKAILASKIIEYCKAQDGFEDIIEICKPIAEDSKPKTTDSGKQPTFGDVYLMKSGRYYKIGKSNSPGRREYEIGIKLPEKLIIIHTIKTDDSTGIEEYWHKRFKDKRKGGEWFDLTCDDINAFKRRKFM